MDDGKTQLISEIIAAFFAAKKSFEAQYENYERMVEEYAQKLMVDRQELHLDSKEVAGLLDFKAVEELRNKHLRQLKDLAHEMFREDDTTDIFDKYVSDIYHETSILKEEHYSVLVYASAYEEGAATDLTERDKILEEVHEFLPRKLHQIANLFEKAQARLEEILPQYGEERVFVRSLYLFGAELLQGIYKGGLEEFYGKVYPSGGPVEGYLTVARSFYESGFQEQAGAALRKARAVLKKSELGEEEKKRKSREITQLRRRHSTEKEPIGSKESEAIGSDGRGEQR